MDGSRSRDLELRIPPYSDDAEQGVLGSLLVSPKTWWQVADMLVESDFYRRDHQLIWRGIRCLSEAKRPFDSVTLAVWFEEQGVTEHVGGSAYVVNLANTQASAFSIKTYAQIVREKSQLRQLIDVGTSLANDAFQARGRTALQLIGDAQTRVSELMSTEPCELEPLSPILGRAVVALQERFASGVTIHGLSTGIDELDELLGGLQPGLILLAARPKMGKTTLAVNIAEHVALNLGGAVGIFTFEMTQEQLAERVLASIGDIDANRIRSGMLDDVDWASVTHTVARIHGAKIFMSRPRRAHVEHVVAQIRRKHAETPLALAVVDYLQLMEWNGDNAAQGIGQITRALKLCSMELGIPILLLSQLNRKLEERPNKRPLPSDARDSGAIEQDCDAMIFVYRDEVYDAKSPDRGTAEIIVGLQRNGPTGKVRVKYQADRFRFSNLPLDWIPDLPSTADGEEAAKRTRGPRRARSVPVRGRDAASGEAA